MYSPKPGKIPFSILPENNSDTILPYLARGQRTAIAWTIARKTSIQNNT
jgi:hypothetical protein